MKYNELYEQLIGETDTDALVLEFINGYEMLEEAKLRDMVSKIGKRFPVLKKLGKAGIALAVVALVNSNALGGETELSTIMKANKQMEQSIADAKLIADTLETSLDVFDVDDLESMQKLEKSGKLEGLFNLADANKAEMNASNIKQVRKDAHGFAKLLYPNITDDELKTFTDTVVKNWQDAKTGGKTEKELKAFALKTLEKVKKMSKSQKKDGKPAVGSDEWLLSPIE
jgi:hypothetical protein